MAGCPLVAGCTCDRLCAHPPCPAEVSASASTALRKHTAPGLCLPGRAVAGTTPAAAASISQASPDVPTTRVPSVPPGSLWVGAVARQPFRGRGAGRGRIWGGTQQQGVTPGHGVIRTHDSLPSDPTSPPSQALSPQVTGSSGPMTQPPVRDLRSP